MKSIKAFRPSSIMVRIGLVAAVIALCAGWFPQTVTAKTPAVDTYQIAGVSVKKYSPAKPNGKAPIVLVHGGSHAAWAWDKIAMDLSRKGWEAHAISWYNHGNSIDLPEAEFLQRSIADVASKEIKHVVDHLGRDPILIGHSMGALASMAYTEDNSVEKLVLIAPVFPSSVQADPIPVPVDMTQPFGPFPYEVAKELYFTSLPENEARYYHSLLVPESPQAVVEATQWTVDVDVTAIEAPTLIFAAEHDALIPLEPLKRMVQMMDADLEFIPRIGHSDILLKDPNAKQTAHDIRKWLK